MAEKFLFVAQCWVDPERCLFALEYESDEPFMTPELLKRIYHDFEKHIRLEHGKVMKLYAGKKRFTLEEIGQMVKVHAFRIEKKPGTLGWVMKGWQ